MRFLGKYLILGLVGGAVFGLLEISWRGWTHWTMLVLGGVCFIAIGLLNELFEWDMALLSQMVIASAIITVGEFLTGLLVNRLFGWEIWDYSGLPYNLWGQISLLWSFIWFWLSLPAILLDDFLRWKWFGEEKPRYKVF